MASMISSEEEEEEGAAAAAAAVKQSQKTYTDSETAKFCRQTC
ncbi:hypothetical protein R8N48_29460 [Vibrio sp. Y184]|nr:hypothetical protein [Vibrio sp. Y184]